SSSTSNIAIIFLRAYCRSSGQFPNNVLTCQYSPYRKYAVTLSIMVCSPFLKWIASVVISYPLLCRSLYSALQGTLRNVHLQSLVLSCGILPCGLSLIVVSVAF